MRARNPPQSISWTAVLLLLTQLFAGTALAWPFKGPVRPAKSLATTTDHTAAHRLGEVSEVEEGPFSGLLKLKMRNGSSWIFRPDDHERAVTLARSRGIPEGTKAIRDRSVFLTSKHLRFGVVPLTVIGEFEGQKGSFQRHLPNAQMMLQGKPVDADEESLAAVAILHFITQNSDGRENNILVEPAKGKSKFHAIDGELTFGPGGMLSAAANLTRGSTLPERLRRRIARVNINAWTKDLLETGLEPVAVQAAVERLKKVRKLGLAALSSQ